MFMYFVISLLKIQVNYFEIFGTGNECEKRERNGKMEKLYSILYACISIRQWKHFPFNQHESSWIPYCEHASLSVEKTHFLVLFYRDIDFGLGYFSLYRTAYVGWFIFYGILFFLWTPFHTCSWNSYHLYFMAQTNNFCSFFCVCFVALLVHPYRIHAKAIEAHLSYTLKPKTYFRAWNRFFHFGIKWKTYEALISLQYFAFFPGSY